MFSPPLETVSPLAGPAHQDLQDATLFFLHGWGSSPVAYGSSLAQAKAMGFQTLTPTIPGHSGEPRLPKGRRTLADVAEHLEKYIPPETQTQHLVLAGHSLGGALASILGQRLLPKRSNFSLLLLSPAGANPIFGPRQWARAFGDLRQERPQRRKLRRHHGMIRNFFANSIRSSRLGWEARISDLNETWNDLIDAGIPITAVHASCDRVVDTEPLFGVQGLRLMSIPRPHDWPVWDKGAFRTALDIHCESIAN